MEYQAFKSDASGDENEKPMDNAQTMTSAGDHTLRGSRRSTNTTEDFTMMVMKLYSQTFASKRLTNQDYMYLKEATERTLTLKARMGTSDPNDVSTEPDAFEVVPGSDRSLICKEDFLETFHAKRRKRPVSKMQTTANVPLAVTDDPQFLRVVKSKYLMQAKLERAALEVLDLNAPIQVLSAAEKPPPQSRKKKTAAKENDGKKKRAGLKSTKKPETTNNANIIYY
ncbi:hypothetical protein R1flu_024755 [Riccia fluitans]|uniref:Uncharacterized protein n=1 Tax=Riccia fluitans TaxID=41844 RepID=A0ABD1XZX9_9MARC